MQRPTLTCCALALGYLLAGEFTNHAFTKNAAQADAPWARPAPAEKVVTRLKFTDPADKAAADQYPDWKLTGKVSLVKDELLGRDVYESLKPPYGGWLSTVEPSGEYVVEALVRLLQEEKRRGSATLRSGVVERDGKRTSSHSITLSAYGTRGFTLAPHVADGTLWTQPSRPGVRPEANLGNRWTLLAGERFPLEKISPVWPEEFRVSVENDMAALPKTEAVWRRLRIEVRADRVRMYHNGLLAFDEPNRTVTGGVVALEMPGPARLASLEVRSLAPLPSRTFEPISLNDIANAGSFVDTASLPPADQVVDVNGVPCLFPQCAGGNDHVDIASNIFRHRQDVGGNGGDPLHCWPPMSQLDPVCIRVRTPIGPYRRLWIVAASDNEANSTPVLTARFYKPLKGWPIDTVAKVPSATATTGTAGAKALDVKLAGGKPGKLWLLPLDLDTGRLSSELREERVWHIELTKEVQDWRAFPDPMNYGSFQAGLPSAVHLYALTLERAPMSMITDGTRHGNVYPHPEKATWKVDLQSHDIKEQTARVTYDLTSPYGQKSQHVDEYRLKPGQSITVMHEPAVAEYGLYKIKTTVAVGDHTQSREGALLTLPPDTRRATAKNSRWGLWVWGGGHSTHDDPNDNLQLLRSLGSMIGGHLKVEDRRPWGLAPGPDLAFYTTPPFALKDPYDPAEYEAYKQECIQKIKDRLAKVPDLQYVSIFAEHSISLRVTHGTPPSELGQTWWEYTPQEQASIKAHLIAAKAAFEATREAAPQLKFLFGHCGPLFSLPFMKGEYPKEWFDGYGVDAPQFERMPERPARAVECNMMYFLNKEMNERGYKKDRVHVESYYPSSHRLALGHRGSADSVVRTAVLSMALGTDRFLACWTLDDCEGYWGSQHYGCIGMVTRRPEFDPKPAAAAFATMTNMIDLAKYDGFLPTGSKSAYCIRFKEGAKNIYCLWTIRGTRPIELTAKPTAELAVVDENGNTKPLPLVDGKATVNVSPTAIWVTALKAPIDKVQAGTPTYTEAPPRDVKQLADFEGPTWTVSPQPDDRYAKNSWDMVRLPANFTAEQSPSDERKSKVLKVALTDKPEKQTLASHYRVIAPPAPLAIPGKARALGMWAKGHSNWGRVVYEVVDAGGEVFQSIGSKDEWNCDDVHSWSYFNYDGWRYLEFPLPGNSPGDNYREKDSVWWNHSADGVVDLPLKLTRLIVEMPTHQIYVDQVLPVDEQTVEFDDLVAVYESPQQMTDAPIVAQRSAAGLLKYQALGADLPNPITAQQETGVGAATAIEKFFPPQHEYDGRRTHVQIKPVASAKEYQVWVSAYEDGRGAAALKKTTETSPLVTGLKPGMPLYFFVTYTDEGGKPSKPSAMQKVTLKDEFLQK